VRETTNNKMKYKIQTESAFGWADFKYSDDDGKTYNLDLYDTEEEARIELNSILSEFGEDDDYYRIVTEDVEEEYNLY
jgi:hypothetical protein